MVSTYPCSDIPGLAEFMVIPAAFGGYAGSQVNTKKSRQRTGRSMTRWLGRLRNLMVPIRYSLGLASISFYKNQFIRFVRKSRFDLVHALRIPFEGMLARHIPTTLPLVISIWGNDLTLHASRNPMMRRATTRTLQRADGLIADACRDIRLAQAWGFNHAQPTAVLPGSGGVNSQAIRSLPCELDPALPARVRNARQLIINPRGFRPGSVRNDTFFSAIPLVLRQQPDTIFACSAMQDQPEAQKWIQRLGIQKNTVLLPYLEQSQLWQIFKRAVASISVSEHDGTPNSLLEAMTCGCYPIAGDIESLREWINPGENGALVNPGDPAALADAILTVISKPELRSRAAAINDQIIQERADVGLVRHQAHSFYQNMIRQ